LFKTFCISFFFLISFSFVKAQKVDTIVHVNGNIMKGEIKMMQYGIMVWKMDGMGTIDVETPKLKTFKSNKRFDVRLKDGSRYYCSFDTSSQNRKVYMLLSGRKKLIAVDDIAQIFPIKNSFWLRTSGSFGFSGNYSKGSDLLTLNLSSSLSHRRETSYFSLSWDTYYTFQSDTLSSIKSDARFSWQRLRRSKISYGAQLGLGQNSQLGTQLRLDFTLVGVYDILFNSWTRLSGFFGSSIEQEYSTDSEIPVENLTGIIAAGWKVYKLTSPKLWVEAEARYIPYFTSDGRYRLNLSLNPKMSLVGNNLKMGFKNYYSFDSHPVSDDAHKDDWGFTLELSYSFH